MSKEAGPPADSEALVAPSPPSRMLTPAARKARRFPVVAGALLAAVEVISIGAHWLGGRVGVAVEVVCKAVAVLACCGLASWLEDRIYTALVGKTRFKRVLVSALLPVAALIGGPIGAAILGTGGIFAQDNGTMMLALMLSSFWLASAAVGSLIIVLLDVVISSLIPDFRSRVQVAILALVTVAAGGSVGVYAAGRAIAAALRRVDPESLGGLDVDIGDGALSNIQLQQLLAMPETAGFISWGFSLVAVLIALPAILSACGKLAEAIMERLHPLSLAFDEVREGKLDVRVEEEGSRDFVKISHGFNRMAGSLELTVSNLDKRNRELQALHQASSRFVPFQFLELLDKQTITDIARGDQIQLEISVAFSDIRAFTTMAEQLGAQQTFAFINRYLAHMEPEIHRESGFINDILGDGIMALYHRGADAAVRASLGMLAALEKLNEELRAEDRPPIRIGIGINSGPLMLGTIGGADRLSCTVVGDPANLAARVEGMTKLYRATLLISEGTKQRLSDPNCYQLREVDRVQAKGKTQPTVLYEVLDGLPSSELEQKLTTLETFGSALAGYREGDFAAAGKLFAACLETAPDDGSAALYVQRCQRLLEHPPVDPWDGVTSLDAK